MAREQVVAELASEATYALEKWHGLSRAYAKKQFEARIEDLTEKEAALQQVKFCKYIQAEVQVSDSFVPIRNPLFQSTIIRMLQLLNKAHRMCGVLHGFFLPSKCVLPVGNP